MEEKDILKQMMNSQSSHKTDSEYVVRGAVIKCSNGEKAAVINLPEDHGVYIQGKPQINVQDSKTENIHGFGTCKITGNQCTPKLSIWQNGNSDNQMFDKNTLKYESAVPLRNSYCVCIKNKGIVELVNSGQTTFKQVLINDQKLLISSTEEALNILEEYLDAKRLEKEAEQAAVYLAKIGVICDGTKIAKLKQYHSKLYPKRNYQLYDDFFMGLTYYINERYGNHIDPNAMKSIATKETHMGNYPGDSYNANFNKDIMQVLDPRNITIYEYAVIDPKRVLVLNIKPSEVKAGKSKTKDYVSPNLSKINMPDYTYKKKAVAMRLFNKTGEDFMYMYEEATPFLSIALGILTYHYKTKGADSLRAALEKYNGNINIDPNNYGKKMNETYAQNIIDLMNGVKTVDDL